nr:hypothetical protein [uncultured Sphingosinicella sp.]
MFNVDFKRVATAAIGALIFTAVTVSAAIVPAHSVHGSTIVTAQSQVADRANV